MIRFDDHRPSLWTERGDRDYGHDLTSSEFLAEELDQPSSRLPPPEAAAVRVPDVAGAPGADRFVTPPSLALGGVPDNAAEPASEEA